MKKIMIYQSMKWKRLPTFRHMYRHRFMQSKVSSTPKLTFSSGNTVQDHQWRFWYANFFYWHFKILKTPTSSVVKLLLLLRVLLLFVEASKGLWREKADCAPWSPLPNPNMTYSYCLASVWTYIPYSLSLSYVCQRSSLTIKSPTLHY